MSRWDKLLSLVNRSCFAAFSIPVVYSPSLDNRMELGGTPVNLMGIFDEHREEITLMADGSSGMGGVIQRSVLEIKISDLGFAPMDGDEVTIAGLTYRILEVQPNGNGMAILIINRKQDPFAF